MGTGIELNFEKEGFSKPNWNGKIVLEDLRYFNSSLNKNPFKTWIN